MKKITIFSWGFWGWGTHAERFVNVVDHVEASRGFKPPIFVDIRIRRTGRAVEFKENTFRDIVGAKRYHWMRGLGNAAIVDKTLDDITIKDPRDAKTLLNLAIESMKRDRRLIFYCACENPFYCHRHVVGSLLLKEAKKLGITLEIVEWPGGKGQYIKEKTTDDIIMKIIKGQQKNYQLSDTINLKKYGALPWGSIVELSSNSRKIIITSGPMKYINHGWALPVVPMVYPKKNITISKLKSIAWNYFKDGYGPRITKAF